MQRQLIVFCSKFIKRIHVCSRVQNYSDKTCGIILVAFINVLFLQSSLVRHGRFSSFQGNILEKIKILRSINPLLSSDSVNRGRC
jgi:hypothetical protein